MLQAIRSKTGSWVVKAFLILIALSFAVWGVGDFVSARIQADDKPIEVGDASVSAVDLSSELRQEVSRMAPMFGGRLTPELAKQFGLVDQVVDRLVAQTAIDALALELGIAASNQVIAQQAHREPAFQGTDGKFDKDIFASALRNAGLNENAYFNLQRDDIRRRQLVTAITAGVNAPESLVEKVYTYRNETRVAETLTLGATNLGSIPDPTEDELRKFYEANAESYRAPEYRKIVAVNLAPALIAKTIQIDEAALREVYDDRIGDYTKPGVRKLTQLLFNSEEDARTAVEMLQEGRAFDAVAAEAAGSGGAIDLGWVGRADLPSDTAADVAFSTQVGGFTEPVQSDFGWHIFRVDESEEESVRPFEEVRDEIEQQMALDRAVEDVYDLLNKLEDAVGAGASIEEAGRQIGVDPIVIDAVDRNGSAPDGSSLVEEFQLSQMLLTTAFEAEQGKASILTETPNNGFFMLRVDGITESRVKDFEEVRDQVSIDWMADRVDAELEALAEAVVSRLEGGEAISAVSAELGVPVNRSQPFLRDTGDASANIGPSLAAQLFGIETGKAVSAPSDSGLTIAVLTEIRPAEDDAEKKKALAGQLDGQLRIDVVDELTRALRDRFGETVNREMIGELF